MENAEKHAYIVKEELVRIIAEMSSHILTDNWLGALNAKDLVDSLMMQWQDLPEFAENEGD